MPTNVGMREHGMRTPGQYEQNYSRELAMTEAALLAGADLLESRIKHTREIRLIDVLKSVRKASEWQPVHSRRCQQSREDVVVGRSRHRHQPSLVEASSRRQSRSGISIALMEELRFDESGITTDNRRSYESPPWQTFQRSTSCLFIARRWQVRSRLRSRQCPGSLADAGALLDATGKAARRIPLKPDYVLLLLNA